jgi:hypothetical protein
LEKLKLERRKSSIERKCGSEAKLVRKEKGDVGEAMTW